MAYNALNNLIDAYIYANGVQAITGQILNGVLKQMVAQLGSGYHLMGVAVPATSPAQNDFAMAYFAATAGEYVDFGGITLEPGEVAVFLTSGNGAWAKQTVYTVPTTTSDLDNTAGFITNTVADLVNYYTKTEIDTTLADYPTLEALATVLAGYYTNAQIDTILEGYTTNTALASALAGYYNKNDIDGLLSVVNTALADRYTKQETDTKLADYYRKVETYDKSEVDSIVAALSRQSYVVAWDGTTAPDVSTIPAGVTVTYSGTPYTGTLAASASTVNKIYMVWNGVAYDMYGTSQDGGYSWVPMGTTSVDLSQYATKAELGQLQHQLDGTASVDYTVTKGQQYGGNGYLSWNRYSCSGQIPSGTYNFKCPPGFYYSVFKYVSDSEGVAVFTYNTTDRNNAYIDGPWILSVKKVDGTELSTADIGTINSAGIVTKVTGDNIDTMRAKINGLVAGFYPLEEFVNGNKSGNFLCLGDSLTFGVGVINNQTPVESANTYPKQMEKILGGKSYNGGVGGSSMVENGSADFPMVVDALTSGDYTELNAMLDSLTGVNTLAKTRWLEIESLNIADLDFIAIAFGVNDWTIGAGIDAVCESLRSGINKLRQAFPGVKLYVFTPTFAYLLGYGMAFNTDNYTSGGLYLDEYCDAIEQLCNELNVPVKNMYYCSGIKSDNAASFYTDGKHRNANGYKLLAKQYAGLIRNN